jgi:hypothetical protein
LRADCPDFQEFLIFRGKRAGRIAKISGENVFFRANRIGFLPLKKQKT